MRIGIIGTGSVGNALGQGFARAGHEVLYGTRDPASIAAAGTADVCVLATPYEAALEVIERLTSDVVVDATNPVGPNRDLAVGHTTSGAEQLAGRTKARVVKAFNTTGFENMANPHFGDARAMMPVAGDDPAATELVAKLASDLGFDPIALKGLHHARELEPMAMLWIKLALAFGLGRGFAFSFARRIASDVAPPPRRTAQPKKILVVGAGSIGGALARAWTNAGHDVRVAVRDPAAAEVREFRAVPLVGAADDADVIALAVPAASAVDAARSLGDLQGRIVIDATNLIGKGFTLVYGHTTSSSEQLANALPGARVVRAFNQQGAEVLQNPIFAGRPAVSFIAADDADARATVKSLSDDIGLDSVEAGPLSSARYIDPRMLLWVALSQTLGTRDFAFQLLRR
jgi:predicted dinucleotide-binding enzyme